MSQTPQAEKYFAKIISGSKSREIIDDSYTLMFEYYYRNNNFVRLKALAEAYTKDYPDGKMRSRAYYYVGEAWYAREDYSNAIASYAQALGLSDDTIFNDSIYQRLGFSFIAMGQYLEAKNNLDNIRNDEFRLYSLGMAYWKIKEYVKALEVLDGLLKDFPQGKFFNNIYLNKAGILYEMGRINDAMFLYRHILTFSGDDYEDIYDRAHYGLARCYLRGGDFTSAVKEFKLVIKYTHDQLVKLSSQIQVADNFYNSENFAEALAVYNNILKNNSKNEYGDYILFQKENIFLKTSKLEDAQSCLDRIGKDYPDSKILSKAKYNLAAGYFSQNIFIKAGKLLSSFIDGRAQDELTPKAAYLYVKCLLAGRKYERALETLKNLSGKFKDSPEEGLFLIEMGDAYAGLSLADKAKEAWKIFLQKFGHSSYAGSVALLLAGAYEKESNYAAAEKYYRVAALKDKDLAGAAFFSLGSICLARADFDKAKDYFQKLKTLDGNLFSKAKFSLAKAYANEGKTAEALAVFDELIGYGTGTSREAAMEKAFFLKGSQDYKQAAAAYKRAMVMGVDAASARFFLGMCLEKTGDISGALTHYAIAASSGDKDYAVKAFFRAARIYEEQGNIELAKKMYRDIIKLNTVESGVAKEKLLGLERR
jgi:tetratricopeptide (TPR) repeat protein